MFAGVTRTMHQLETDIRSRLLSARLPVMPQILLKLVETCQSDDAGMSTLASLIASDPGLTSKVLAVANSSAYHRGGRPAGLEAALATLGTNMIRTLVINESVMQVFNHLTHANGTDLRAFWKHSLTVATLAREIAAKVSYSNPEEAYLAGLLHDIGRLALLATATKEYAFIFFARDDDKLGDIEHNLLNVTHTEAGAILADRWNLDSFLADSVLYHHEPAAHLGNAHPLVRIMVLAHLAADRREDDPALSVAATASRLNPDEIPALLVSSRAKVAECAEMLGIDLAGADDLSLPIDGWEIAGRLASLEEAHARPATADDDSTAPPLAPQERARRALAEEVGTTAITSALSMSLAQTRHDEHETLAAIAHSARILFGFHDIIVFRKNAAGDALVGAPPTPQAQRATGFSIRLDGDTRLSRAAQGQQVLFATRTQEPGDLAESQLMRLFECDGLIALPLKQADEYDGMLIGGIGAWQMASLHGRERFLRAFGEQALAALRARRTTVTGQTPPAPRTDAAEVPRKIVHESNNALSIIKNYLSVLDGRLGKQQVDAKEIAILHEEVDRVGRIINGLGSPSRTPSPLVADIDTTIRNVVQLFRDTAPSPRSTQVFADTQETPCEIACAPESLKQILINLVKNAIEAMPENGEIRVINNGLVNRDGRLYGELCVRDNGPGIPRPLLATLFSPVRTTKGNAHQGLGLHIVHDLVKQSHGLISCRSSQQGTAFEILFPAHSLSHEKSARDTAP